MESIHAELWLLDYSLCSALLPLVELLLPAGTTDGTVSENVGFPFYIHLYLKEKLLL